MVRHRNFQSVIGSLTLKAEFFFILFFLFLDLDWALINRSGAMVRHRYFQSVLGLLNRGSLT